MAGKTKQPFAIGPLNGGLPWPQAFAGEQKRERERLRALRGLYRALPYARSTYRRSDAILASFGHTVRDIGPVADPAKLVSVPEIGFDPDIFHARDRRPPFSGPGPYRFVFAGRLVPYKVPEVVVRGFVESERLRPHQLDVLGEGPELDRLNSIVAAAGAEDRVSFVGRKSQSEVADAMRAADAFVFPSIRELGAGVVIEAMACGVLNIVSDYGAPGDLVGESRGLRLPLGPPDALAASCRAAMESCLDDPAGMATRAAAGRDWADRGFTWDAKADFTLDLYERLLSGRDFAGLDTYA